MIASEDADYLFQRTQEEASKARAAFERGDDQMTIFMHREQAVMFQAKAMLIKDGFAIH